MSRNGNNRLEIIQSRIDQYGIRFPIAELEERLGFDKGYISSLLKGKKPVSDNFWSKFNETYPEKIDTPPNGAQRPTDLLTGANVTLQDYINELRNDKAVLYSLANSILDQIKLDTKTALAYQMAWVEYEAERSAKGDEQLKLELIHRMNTLVRSYLPGRVSVSSESETGKQSKG